MTLRVGLILAALGACIIFVWFALHWRKEAAEQRARADAAVLQSGLDVGTGAIADQVASDRVIILEKGQKEIEYVETLPGADTPLDPVRRAGKCASLARVLGHPVCTPDKPDAEPTDAMPDRVGDGAAGDTG